MGLPQTKVARVAKVGICTVKCIAATKRSGKGHERKPGSSTHCCVSNQTLIKTFLGRIMENPKNSLWQHSWEMGVSLDTIRRSEA